MSGIQRDKLPDLMRAVDVLGPLTSESAADLGLRPGMPVVMGTPDLQWAAIGSGAVHDYAAHLYLGTSSWLTCHVPFKKTDLSHNMCSLPSALPDRYLIANEQDTAAANAWSICATRLLFPDDELQLAPRRRRRACGRWTPLPHVPAGSGKLIFMPWFNGSEPRSTTARSAAVSSTCRSRPRVRNSSARLQRGRLQFALAARIRRAVHPAAVRNDQSDRRRRQGKRVVPDTRRRDG